MIVVTDLRSALRWVACHADDLGVHPDAIVLWGHSAGAHIALTTAATKGDQYLDHAGDDRAVPVAIAAVIDCYAPVSFHPEDTSMLQIGPGGIDLADGGHRAGLAAAEADRQIGVKDFAFARMRGALEETGRHELRVRSPWCARSSCVRLIRCVTWSAVISSQRSLPQPALQSVSFR